MLLRNLAYLKMWLDPCPRSTPWHWLLSLATHSSDLKVKRNCSMSYFKHHIWLLNILQFPVHIRGRVRV